LHLVRAPAGGALLTMLADTMMPEAFRYRGKQVGLERVMNSIRNGIGMRET